MSWTEVLPLLTVIVVPLVAVMGGAWAAQIHNSKQILAHVDTKLDAQTAATKAGFDAQAAATKAGFDAVDRHFVGVDQRFEDQTTNMNTRFDAVDRRFDGVDQRFEDQTTNMNTRFDSVDRHFDGVDGQIGELRDDLRSLSNRVDALAAAGAAV